MTNKILFLAVSIIHSSYVYTCQRRSSTESWSSTDAEFREIQQNPAAVKTIEHVEDPYLLHKPTEKKLQASPRRAGHQRTTTIDLEHFNPPTTPEFDSVSPLSPEQTNLMTLTSLAQQNRMFLSPRGGQPAIIFERQNTPSPSELPVPSPAPLRRTITNAFQNIATTSPEYTARPTLKIPQESDDENTHSCLMVHFPDAADEKEEQTSPFHALHQRVATPFCFTSETDFAKKTLLRFFKTISKKSNRNKLTSFCLLSRSPHSRQSFYDETNEYSRRSTRPSCDSDGFITPPQEQHVGTYNRFAALADSSTDGSTCSPTSSSSRE